MSDVRERERVPYGTLLSLLLAGVVALLAVHHLTGRAAPPLPPVVAMSAASPTRGTLAPLASGGLLVTSDFVRLGGQ